MSTRSTQFTISMHALRCHAYIFRQKKSVFHTKVLKVTLLIHNLHLSCWNTKKTKADTGYNCNCCGTSVRQSIVSARYFNPTDTINYGWRTFSEFCHNFSNVQNLFTNVIVSNWVLWNYCPRFPEIMYRWRNYVWTLCNMPIHYIRLRLFHIQSPDGVQRTSDVC